MRVVPLPTPKTAAPTQSAGAAGDFHLLAWTLPDLARPPRRSPHLHQIGECGVRVGLEHYGHSISERDAVVWLGQNHSFEQRKSGRSLRCNILNRSCCSHLQAQRGLLGVLGTAAVSRNRCHVSWGKLVGPGEQLRHVSDIPDAGRKLGGSAHCRPRDTHGHCQLCCRRSHPGDCIGAGTLFQHTSAVVSMDG